MARTQDIRGRDRNRADQGWRQDWASTGSKVDRVGHTGLGVEGRKRHISTEQSWERGSSQCRLV